MASRFGITANQVRLIVGLGTTDISDSDTTTFIEWAEYEAENNLKSKFGSNEKAERITSYDGSNVARLKSTPINVITEVRVGGTGITPKNVKFDRMSGRIILTDDAEDTNWDDTGEKENYVKYKHGRLERTTTQTALTNNGTAGQATLHVGTSVGFTTNDYIMVVGTGTGGTTGHSEILTVTGTGTNTITVTENKQYDHRSGADVVKMEVPSMAKQLAQVLAGLGIARRMVGKTFKFATSYSIPEISVTKGVPYPHFERLVAELKQMRDRILREFRPEMAVA